MSEDFTNAAPEERPTQNLSCSPDGELHLIVLWEKARKEEERIIKDVRQKLQLLQVYDMGWSPGSFASNMSRFYGVKLGSIAGKVSEVGKGRFLLLILWDPAPDYRYADGSRGTEWVNMNLFSLKQKYREWTGGGSKIHSTCDTHETDHDLTLLLGICSEDYLKQDIEPWSGDRKRLDRDLPGCHGWSSLRELFYVLNHTHTYAVLRNYECLPEQYRSAEHGDIDLLVTQKDDAALLLNAHSVYAEPHRVHYCNMIDGKKVYWDLRHLGDDYYCREWEEEMLRSRVLAPNGFYTLSDRHYFYSLVYHAVIHKRSIAADYYTKAAALLPKTATDTTILNRFSQPFDAYFSLLRRFMREHGYAFTRPLDTSVFFRAELTRLSVVQTALQSYGICGLEPVMLHLCNPASGYCYFCGQKGEEMLFIKWGGLDDSVLTEYRFARALYLADEKHSIRPVFCRCKGQEKWFAQYYEPLPHRGLDDLLGSGSLSPETQTRFISDLHAIAMALRSSRIIHRDVRPANLILASDGHLKLIDFQFAISYPPRRRISGFDRRNFYKILGLGGGYSPAPYAWDDMYSLAKIMREIGVPTSVRGLYHEVESLIGSMRFTLPLRYRILRKIRRILSHLMPLRSLRRKLRCH